MEEEAKEEADSEGQCSVNMVRFLSYILFSLALILALVASGFYANKHQSRNLSPSQSREKNAECVFLDFYDNHDLWHSFLPSPASSPSTTTCSMSGWTASKYSNQMY